MADMRSVWHKYWDSQRFREVQTDDDLFYQVAQTINGRSIPGELFRLKLGCIKKELQLSPGDHLVDFCCGNGLFTYELAAGVHKITAIDFSENLIRVARQQKYRGNIDYCLGEATDDLSRFIVDDVHPNKFVMNDSLGNFTPSGLTIIVHNILDLLHDRPFQFLLAGVPNIELKWNYYNTTERRARHLENERKADNTNDGLGRWWTPEEIVRIGSGCGLSVRVSNQSPELSNYRMNVMISR